MRAAAWLFAWCCVAGPVAAQERVLDDFTDIKRWSIGATDDVVASLRSAPARIAGAGQALCIDYDFGQVTGYVTARRELPIDYPLHYEFGLNVRGDAPANALQFKLVDASGENVWWMQRPDYVFPHDWRTLRLRQRQIEFAWGPSNDKLLRRSASIELVIASGSGGGKGSACFDRLTLTRLPDVTPAVVEPRLIAGPGVTIDNGAPREFNALTLQWKAGAPAARYDIEVSDDGLAWQRLRHVERARGTLQSHWLGDSEARFIRVIGDAAEGALGAPTLTTRQLASVDAFYAQLASEAPRGTYPRAYVGEQAYWTVLGVDGGRVASLLGEDGALESLPGIGALEPLLVVDGRVLSWADARIEHRLREERLPMPSVHWQLAEGLSLDIDAFGQGTPEAARALARYTVRNLGANARRVSLALAWRPFQVNPPTQFLAHPGGASELGEIGWDGRSLSVGGVLRLHALTPPDSVRLEPAAAGPVRDWLTEPVAPTAVAQMSDPAGGASGVLRYGLTLKPGEAREVLVALPVDRSSADLPALNPAEFAREEAAVASHWRARLDRVRLTGGPELQAIARTLHSAVGQILVNRSGPALQPGARAYARSWIRDGALTSSALLRMGQEDVARDFLRWFAPFQFKNGKVPCCATTRGADPVPENDSDGEFAFAAAELWRYTRDDATARAMWPHVAAAIEHMERLRAGERTSANRTPERAAYFGLMPRSISHEGYSDRPAYSYWDDFWAYTGYRSATELAQGLGLTQPAARLAAQRDAFLADLRASVDASAQRYGRAMLYGAADRGDVDPTSSTIALSPGGLLGSLPEPLLRNTFERYWQDFVARRDGPPTWQVYTPYEWRNVGALLRLGERERALQALAFFEADQRPAGWHQWAEVVGRDPRVPRFIGDMPHGWVASDQIRAVLDLFGYEHEGTNALVLAAGVPMRWLQGEGVAIAGLRTPYGPLSWRARATRNGSVDTVRFSLDALREQPPGGIVLRGPWPGDAKVWVEGRRQIGPADAIAIAHTPAQLRIEFSSPQAPGR